MHWVRRSYQSRCIGGLLAQRLAEPAAKPSRSSSAVVAVATTSS